MNPVDPPSAEEIHFVGVDIGTESVRAGLFRASGQLLSVAKRPIQTWHAPGGVMEQSTDQIWPGVVEAMREILGQNPNARIGAIGFCATCSMALIGADGRAIRAGGIDQDQGGEGEPVPNVIVWMDHRATSQAARINASAGGTSSVLRFIGGQISPEMQTPKLLWLKENVSETFARTAHFFDLADLCTWRATGFTERSICTLTCKWTFLGHEQRWDPEFLRATGLGIMVDEDFRRIGQTIRPIGTRIGAGLCRETARELGLPEGLPVGAGLIDAHAGALGTISVHNRQQMALILGTSLCTMSLSEQAHFVAGVWGPYFGVVRPNLWLNEGGMTAFGSALMFAIRLHPFYAQIKLQISDDSRLMDHLEQCAVIRAGSVEVCSTAFGAHLHIVPDFLGNRSPDADPLASGTVSGLRMDDPMWGQSEAGMAEWMVTVMCALCYGAKQITDQIERESGTLMEELVVSGGMVRSTLLLRLIADILQKRVFLPQCSEPVLLGSAMSGAVASGKFGTIDAAIRKMVDDQRHGGRMVEPQRQTEVVEFHQHKFRAYMALKECEKVIRGI